MASKPEAVRLRANEGGAWKAKQLEEPEPHFDVPPTENVSSRFPKVRSASCRLRRTPSSESRPPFGGVPYAEASTVSPTHWIVIGFVGTCRWSAFTGRSCRVATRG